MTVQTWEAGPAERNTSSGGPAFHRHFAVLFAILLSGYLLTFSGAHFGRVADGQQMVETALSLYEYQSLAVFNPGYHKSTASGPATYSKYGLGFPLVLQIPLFLSDHLHPWLRWRNADVLFGFTNLILNLLTSLLIAASARRLGFGVPATYVASLSFAFGSFAWPYISYDFSEPLQAFCLTVAFWALLHVPGESASPRSWLMLSGGSLGFGVLTKVTLLVTVPIFALYLWLRTRDVPGQRLRMQRDFWGPVLLCGVALATLNWIRFHAVLEFGYGSEARQFTTPLGTGLYGLLLSVNKGLIFYAPITLLLPLGLGHLYGRRRNEFIFVSSLAVCVVIPIAKWWSWEGGVSWGPRLLYPILPILVLASAYPSAHRKWVRYGSVAALLAGAAVNLTGVLFYFGSWGAVIGVNKDRVPLDVDRPHEGQRLVEGGPQVVPPYVAANFIPGLSPLRGHAWILRWRWLDIPFPMDGLQTEAARDAVPFGPVSINMQALAQSCAGDQELRRDLQSAQLLVTRAFQNGTGEGRPLPVRGRAFLQCGLRLLGEKRNVKAYEALRRAKELGCESPQLLPSLGIACVRLGKFPEGSGYFEEYLERVPGANSARLFYAQSLEANGLKERALAQYVRLREFRPDESQAAAIEERIAALSQALSRRPKEGP
jgi:hypothetical protein